MLVWHVHRGWRRSRSCFRLQHVMLWQRLRVLRWSQSSQPLQLFYRCPDSTSSSLRSNNRSKCRTMAVSRMLHVSRSLHVLYRFFLTSIFLISDETTDRTLPNQVAVSSNTIESCTAACFNAGYTLAGAEYSAECWCSTSIGGLGAPATASDCNMLCTGNSSEYCGGPNRLNLYNYSTVVVPPPPSGPIIVPSVGLWKSLGCYT